MAKLDITFGCMFAGKSTETIRQYNLAKTTISDDKILCINHTFDNRANDDSNIRTHDGVKIPCIKLKTLSDIFKIDNFKNIKYVFIDEGQFFDDLYETVKILLLEYRMNIHISCLDGDYKQEPFYNSRVLNLIPYASTIKKLTAKCEYCNDIAPFTKRLINSEEQILVGGADSYKPVCLNHL
jgi:thymidine kinase